MKKRKKDPDFPKGLHELVKPYIEKMGIFICNRKRISDNKNLIYIQRGVLRTNCIDSLDRTNEAQCFIGMYVLEKQLKQLGIILESSEIRPLKIGDLGSRFKKLFDDHGDMISL